MPKSSGNKIYEFEIRIAYADTDRLGVVYYGNYFTLFERGRTELMRNAGFRYKDLEDNYKIFLPVLEAHCRYVAPAHYDDLIRIKTWIKELKAAHIDFEYEIEKADTHQPLAMGSTRHPFVNEHWKPTRIPKDLRDKLLSL